MSTINIYLNLQAQLDKLFAHNRQGSFKTRERYYEAMQRFCRFLAEIYHVERLANIAPKHVIAYARDMQERGLSASTIKTDLSAIRFWHDKLSNPRHKSLPSNEALDLERRAFAQEDRRWSASEFNRMIAVCWRHGHEDYLTAMCLARHAGLRIHECFRIDTATAQAAIKTMEITIKGKGGRIRIVPINGTIRIQLEKILAVTPRGHKLLVPPDVKTDVAITRLQWFIAKHRERIRDPDSMSPLTFHGLRHSFACERYIELLAQGYGEHSAKAQVSQWLGHSRADVTNIYLAGLKGGDSRV